MDKELPGLSEIEQAIRLYLRAHPRAVDTERGIAEWWLLDLGSAGFLLGDVAIAIARLVQSGELVPRALPDGRLVYQAPGPTDRRLTGFP